MFCAFSKPENVHFYGILQFSKWIKITTILFKNYATIFLWEKWLYKITGGIGIFTNILVEGFFFRNFVYFMSYNPKTKKQKFLKVVPMTWNIHTSLKWTKLTHKKRCQNWFSKFFSDLQNFKILEFIMFCSYCL